MAETAQVVALDQAIQQMMDQLPEAVRHRVQSLRDLHEHHAKLEEEYRREKEELDKKYQVKYEPLYEERRCIVTGEKEAPAAAAAATVAEDPKGIPDFWLNVLLRCDVTSESVSEKDQEVLKYLQDISSDTLRGEKGVEGFKLRFTFRENPYFTDKVLEKTYHLVEEDYEPVLEKAEGCTIHWLPGKNVTVKVLKRKPKKGGKASDKPQTKTEPVESFFNFFSPPQVPDGANEDMDDEEMEELQSLIEADYEMGATLRDRIIPHAVRWYTGEALQDEFGDLVFDGDEGEEGEEDEDDDDDDEDESASATVPGGKLGAPGPDGQPQECKQQ